MTYRIIILSPVSVLCQKYWKTWLLNTFMNIFTTITYQMIYSLQRFHSSETALLKIHNDIVDNMDNDKVTALTLLDLSAAFDTIDHLILLQRLHRYFGISGPDLQWFKSYFSKHYRIWHIILPTTPSILSAARIHPWPCSVQLIYYVTQPSHY